MWKKQSSTVSLPLTIHFMTPTTTTTALLCYFCFCCLVPLLFLPFAFKKMLFSKFWVGNFFITYQYCVARVAGIPFNGEILFMILTTLQIPFQNSRTIYIPRRKVLNNVFKDVRDQTFSSVKLSDKERHRSQSLKPINRINRSLNSIMRFLVCWFGPWLVTQVSLVQIPPKSLVV